MYRSFNIQLIRSGLMCVKMHIVNEDSPLPTTTPPQYIALEYVILLTDVPKDLKYMLQ